MLFYATFRLYNLLVGGLIFLGDCKSPKEWLGHFLTTEYKSVETPNGTFDRTEETHCIQTKEPDHQI